MVTAEHKTKHKAHLSMELSVPSQTTYPGSWPSFHVIKIWNLGTHFIKSSTTKSEENQRIIIKSENKFLENRTWMKACWQMKQTETAGQNNSAAELGIDFLDVGLVGAVWEGEMVNHNWISWHLQITISLYQGRHPCDWLHAGIQLGSPLLKKFNKQPREN